MSISPADQIKPAVVAVLEVLPQLAGADRAAVLADLDGAGREVLLAVVRAFADRAAAAAAACHDLLADVDTDTDLVFEDQAEAKAWYRRNLPVIPVVVAAAVALGADDVVWRIVVDAEQGYLTELALPAWQQVVAAGQAAAGRLGDPVAAARVMLTSGTMNRFAARPAQAVSEFTLAVEAFERAGDTQGRNVALNRLATVCFDTRDLDTALDLFGQVVIVSVGQQDPQLRALAMMNLAEVHSQRGDHDQAVSFARKALEILEACGGAPQRITQAHLYLARALVGSQDLDEAGPHVRRVLEDTAGWDDYATVALAAHLVHGDFQLASGRYDLAQAAFESAVAMRLGGYLQADIQEGLGRALAGQRRFADAVVLLQLALANREQVGVAFRTADTLYFLAQALDGTGRCDEAEQAAGQALDLLVGIDDPAAQELRARLGARPL